MAGEAVDIDASRRRNERHHIAVLIFEENGFGKAMQGNFVLKIRTIRLPF